MIFIFFDRWDRVTQSLSEADAVKMLKELTIQEPEAGESTNKTVEEHVPDGQVEIKLWVGEVVMKALLITVELKTGTDSYFTARNQAWMQSLVGLANCDTSYALLITPFKAEVLQLYVQDVTGTPSQVLRTRSKSFNFLDDKFNFSVKNFLALLDTLVGIMHKAIKPPVIPAHPFLNMR